MNLLPTPQLSVADDATFWPWQRWTQFAAWPNRETTLVALPVAGLADWGLGAPLDAEETVLSAVVQGASQLRQPGESLLVLPPLRFVLGPYATCAFPVDPPTAHGFIEEVVQSVAAAGFRRIVLINASPWNEELVDTAARDLRIDHGLQMFCINLAALGLDFHPARGGERTTVRALLGALPSTSPELTAASRHLAALLTEIHGRPLLPNHGKIPAIGRP